MCDGIAWDDEPIGAPLSFLRILELPVLLSSGAESYIFRFRRL